MLETEYQEIDSQVRSCKAVQNLMPGVNVTTLKAAHQRQKKKKAVGIDGTTKSEYEQNLDENLESIIERMKRFSYRPLPVRRTYITKEGSDKMRPLGIPAYEDRLVQGVMADILIRIYEPKFLECSYGFRPNHDCHKATEALSKKIIFTKADWLVDVDIKGFFDNVNHNWLIKFLEHDIEDKNFIRYIKRFLKSGVMEDGKRLESDKGTPQGGLISPTLANVYLHYVLDLWFEKKVRGSCRGNAQMVRYADDFVCVFEREDEAMKFYEALKERFAKFGLEFAEDKSKVIRFGRFARQHGVEETFDFLGFRFINATSRNGKYTVACRTSPKKMKVKVAAMKRWLRDNMHIDKQELIQKINQKLVGHYRYYGITGNTAQLNLFCYFVTKELYRVLNRRSQRKLTWEKFKRILVFNPITQPKIYHKYA